MPRITIPALAGSGLIALALPVFVAAGWPLQGWLLAILPPGAFFALALAIAGKNALDRRQRRKVPGARLTPARQRKPVRR